VEFDKASSPLLKKNKLDKKSTRTTKKTFNLHSGVLIEEKQKTLSRLSCTQKKLGSKIEMQAVHRERGKYFIKAIYIDKYTAVYICNNNAQWANCIFFALLKPQNKNLRQNKHSHTQKNFVLRFKVHIIYINLYIFLAREFYVKRKIKN